MAAYITLSNSNNTLTKRLRTLMSGYAPTRTKIGTRRVTTTGKWDNQVGPVLRSWKYTLIVYAIDPTDPSGTDSATSGYGTLAHLKTFFDYHHPTATPSNVLTFIDYDSVSHSVYFVGQLSERNFTPTVVDGCAVFQVAIEMQEVTPSI